MKPSCAVLLLLWLVAPAHAAESLQVGAAIVDISPLQMPVLVNGGFLSKQASEIKTTVNARAIVADDGEDRIAIVVLDSCMVPTSLLDAAKQRASARTKLAPDKILISATHTHTAPSAFGALGTAADQSYLPLLRERIVEAIIEAEANLQPARVGWSSTTAEKFTSVRRWVRRPDRVDNDPFGNPTVRANMHAAKKIDDVTGPSGPEDPELSMIAFQATDGTPIAVLCNYSMHYFGDQPISADYFGLFSDGIAQHALSKFQTTTDVKVNTQVVGIMSHGCSGDIWRRDYMTWTGKDDATIEGYTQQLLELANAAYDEIQFSDDGDIAMSETRIPLRYRVPDQQRLKWAEEITSKIENETPKDRTEVYAREQVILHQLQQTEVVVQALKIGSLSIVTTPNETYALTGLKLKLQSPFERTMVIELANGADGYIPPPEQHYLGGYNTWPARSAGLEVEAEPIIVAAGLKQLEKISGQPRKLFQQSVGPSAQSILSRKPLAYWRLDEMEASLAHDSSRNHHTAAFEPGVLFFLPGDPSDFTTGEQNRSVHFAGGRVCADLPELTDHYSIELSIWNGMPEDARGTTGWFISRDHDHGTSRGGDHFGVSGTETKGTETKGTETTPGTLVFQHGNGDVIAGTTKLQRWKWYRVRIVRSSNRVQVFLGDQEDPEIDAELSSDSGRPISSFFIGGRSDNDANWEGRIDEVAVFDDLN